MRVPPSDFHPSGHVLWAKFVDSGPAFSSDCATSYLQESGRKHEKRALVHLEELARATTLEFRAGPWLRYCGAAPRSIPRYCRPDALIFNHSSQHCTIVEIKLSHCERAWWQLWKLYHPVLRAALPEFRFSCVELVRYVARPVTDYNFKLISDPLQQLPLRATGLYIFSTKTRRARGCAWLS